LVDTCFDDDGGGETAQCLCYYIDPNIDLFKGHNDIDNLVKLDS